MLVLDRVDLCANRGQIVALLGSNGAGKTILVRVFTTLLRPDGGRAWVGGYDVVEQPRPVRSMIGAGAPRIPPLVLAGKDKS